jgi:MFS family permease
MPPPQTTPENRGRRLGRNVLALSAVSLLTDVASEMTYPLLPAFLATTLGASAMTVGAIEGAAESVASLLKLVSGWWSDRVARRKPFVVLGYGIASLVRPLVGLAQTGGQVLAIRLSDRVGKGLRTSPRDALIADSVPVSDRGRAFGFQRAADNAGALLGPLAAFALLSWGGLSLRTVFLLTAIPGFLALFVLVLGVREEPKVGPAPAGASGGAGRTAFPRGRGRLGRPFWTFLALLLLFTFGNSSDAFLLLRATEVGVPAALLPILWAMLQGVKALLSAPAGALSDRIGRKPLLVAGWLVYAAVYLGVGRAAEGWQIWLLFASYGLFFGLTEGVEKAMIADLAPADRRGAAFGWYNLAMGLGALPASLLFGAIWDSRGAASAFTLGAGLALAAALGVALLVDARPGGAAPGPKLANSSP